MILLESVAAVLTGLAVIALILSPLLGQRTATTSTVDDPEELDETPKGIALSALREIEFDRATGKLSDEDYQALKAKYTAEALAVLRNEDAAAGAPAAQPGGPLVGTPELAGSGVAGDASPAGGPAGQDDPVEALVAERLRLLQAGAARCPSCGPRPESDALFCSSCGRSLTVGGCAECGAPLIPGSRFCENCGVAVAR